MEYCAADQRLCFRYIDTTIPLLPKSTISARFVSDLVGNPDDRLSRDEAQLLSLYIETSLHHQTLNEINENVLVHKSKFVS